MAIESQAFAARNLTTDVEVYNKTADAATAGDWEFVMQVGDGTGSGDDPEKAASTISVRVMVNGEVVGGGQQNVAKDAFAADTPARLRTNSVYIADGKTLTIDLESDNANDTAVKVAVTPRKVGVNIEQISGGATAANNLELAFDGTGYGFTNCVIPTVTALAGHTAQTGDSYAVVSHADYGNAQLVRSTTPANTLGVDASGRIDVGSWLGTAPLALDQQRVQSKADLYSIL